jgi:hypothetical protein
MSADMLPTWAPAHGEHELPFMRAANRALQGDLSPCPVCGGPLRAYFHVIQPQTRTGSLWVWCGSCGTYTHLPRVKPALQYADPFAKVPLDEFRILEAAIDDPFFDRLERMWNDGNLVWPRSNRR